MSTEYPRIRHTPSELLPLLTNSEHGSRTRRLLSRLSPGLRLLELFLPALCPQVQQVLEELLVEELAVLRSLHGQRALLLQLHQRLQQLLLQQRAFLALAVVVAAWPRLLQLSASEALALRLLSTEGELLLPELLLLLVAVV